MFIFTLFGEYKAEFVVGGINDLKTTEALFSLKIFCYGERLVKQLLTYIGANGSPRNAAVTTPVAAIV